MTLRQFTIRGDPRTKKNSAQIRNHGGKPSIAPSKAFTEYQAGAWIDLIGIKNQPITEPINLQAVYYMQTRRRVDLVGLLQATQDILTHYGVIEDDNCGIVVSTNGSRVRYDPKNPRVEITITTSDEAEPAFRKEKQT